MSIQHRKDEYETKKTDLLSIFYRKLKKHLQKLCNTARGRELPECLDGSIFGMGGGASSSSSTPGINAADLTTEYNPFFNATTPSSDPSNLPSPFDTLCNGVVDDIVGNFTGAAGCNTTVFNGTYYCDAVTVTYQEPQMRGL
jgi:hypothetical protein